MSTTDDTLDDRIKNREDGDRVYYATGLLLDQEAFRVDQDYHRARLAAATAALGGCGTLAGLSVAWDKTTDEIQVNPGVALDRLGRIIELGTQACLRVAPWYAQIPSGTGRAYAGADVAKILGVAASDATAVPSVIADVWIRFAVCERGKTPAFARGPFDALDATAPSRLRDAYEIKLITRLEDPPLPKPYNPFSTLTLTGSASDKLTALKKFLVNNFTPTDPPQSNIKGYQSIMPDTPNSALPAHASFDPNAVFLARVAIPVKSAGGSNLPDRDTTKNVVTYDAERPFVLTANSLALLMGT